ncbi:MAG TPA: hypothetical protein VLK82_19050 [Candidatus Tectomicrobia bacterium]|nr:hypothetical protein [Candidatus Tectomicrobia bacterium]
MGTLILSRRLTAISPAIPLAEAIDTTRIHSVDGFTGDRIAFFPTRPFRTSTTPSWWASAGAVSYIRMSEALPAGPDLG